MIASFDTAKRLDFVVRKGNTFNKNIIVKNPDGTNFDFTGYTATFKVYTSPFDTIANLTIPVVLTSGNINLTTTIASINQLRRQPYIYFLVLTNGSQTGMWLNGKWTIVDGFSEVIDSTDEIVIDPDGSELTLTIAGFTSNATAVEAENGVSISGGKVRLGGNPLIVNTTIEGNNANLSLGSADSPLANFFVRASQTIQQIAVSSWAAIVGTAQIVMNTDVIGFINAKKFEFKKGDEEPVLEIITEDIEETIKPIIKANAPVKLLNIITEEQLTALIANAVLYGDGSLAFLNISGRQPGMIYNYGGGWSSPSFYGNQGNSEIPSAYFVPTLQQRLSLELQGFAKPGDRIIYSIVVDLEGVAQTEIGVRMTFNPLPSGATETTDIVILNTNTPGKYVVDILVDIGNAQSAEPYRQYVTVKISGAGDKNTSGWATFNYPIESEDTGIVAIQLIGSCVTNNLARRVFYSYYKLIESLF